MAYESLPTVVVGEAVRATSWGNLVKDNLDDHEERIGDSETSVSDHEDRIDLLESSGPSSERIFVATSTITHAQLLLLHSTPVTVVTAPDLNYRLKFIGVTYYTSFENGGYGSLDATYSAIAIQTTATDWMGGVIANDSGASLTKLTDFFAQTAPRAVDVGPYVEWSGAGWITPYIDTPTGSVDAQALQIGLDNNGAGAISGGHVSNFLTAVVRYAVEAVPAGAVLGSRPFVNYLPHAQKSLVKRIRSMTAPANTLYP